MEVRSEVCRHHRAVRATRLHDRHNTFVMSITSVVMETLVQPRPSGHRKAKKELKSERENQGPLDYLMPATSLHGPDSISFLIRRQLRQPDDSVLV